MKMLTLSVIIILVAYFSSLAMGGNNPQLSFEGMPVNYSPSDYGNIFYQDPDNQILLIDFKEVSAPLTKIQVLKGRTVLMEDELSDLAADSIYEVDLKEFKEGNYVVTLTTRFEGTIEEEIRID